MSTAFEGVEPEPLSDPESIPLFPGQQLDRATFHARYLGMPPGIKAELLQGTVFMPSPVGREHAGPTAKMAAWLEHYSAYTPGTEVFDNGTVLLTEGTEVQPDLCIRIDPASGGQSGSTGDYISGSPELIVEVAVSSDSYDLHSKRVVYAQAGVKEYLVFLPRAGKVFWLIHRGGDFERLSPGEDGLYRSEAFPGLWLDPEALIRLDTIALLETLRRGLATEEHSTFAARLAQARAERSGDG